jgi:L-fuconolactonase
MAASNWPVALLAMGYVQVWEELDRALGDLAGAERAAILGGTAARVYGLEGGQRDGRPAP